MINLLVICIIIANIDFLLPSNDNIDCTIYFTDGTESRIINMSCDKVEEEIIKQDSNKPI